MSEGSIYHICGHADWEAAKRYSVYTFNRGVPRRGGQPDQEGGTAQEFIHFSTRGQIEESAALHCAGLTDLVLLEVAAADLGDALRWEAGRGGAPFPHLYGPLPVAAVTRSWDLPLGPDGRHRFPWHDGGGAEP